MKSLSVVLVLLLAIILIGCENRIETAKKLWDQKKQNEAIAKLNDELARNPENTTAKSMLEQYQVSIWLDEARTLWEAGNKKQAIDLLKGPITKYPNNIELNKLYKSYDKLYLSREKAGQMIKNRFPKPVSVSLGLFSSWPGAGGVYYYLEDVKTLSDIKKKGFINYKVVEKISSKRLSLKVKLTKKAKQFVMGEVTSDFRFVNSIPMKGCEKKFLKVTGILPFERGKKGAEVEYEWAYANPTPFGPLNDHCNKDLGKSQKGKITFYLYDDGWRIAK